MQSRVNGFFLMETQPLHLGLMFTYRHTGHKGVQTQTKPSLRHSCAWALQVLPEKAWQKPHSCLQPWGFTLWADVTKYDKHPSVPCPSQAWFSALQWNLLYKSFFSGIIQIKISVGACNYPIWVWASQRQICNWGLFSQHIIFRSHTSML